MKQSMTDTENENCQRMASCSSGSGSIRIGSIEELSWRMDPEVSFSDWCIDIQRVGCMEEDQHVKSEGSSEDLVIITTTDRYHVHRNILAVGPRHSEYFAAQFQAPMQERFAQRTIISLDDARADVFPMLLDFLYSGELPDPFTPQSAAALHSLSEYFDMEQLRRKIENFYRTQVTISHIEDFIQSARRHHAEPLLRIAIEISAQHILQMTTETARQLGPDLLLDILQTNATQKNDDGKHRRRYGFHTSKLVAECCHSYKDTIPAETFRALTDVDILPYLEATAAIYLLSMEADVCENAFDDSSDMIESTSKNEACLSISLHQRCTQSITDKWANVRQLLLRIPRLNQAFERIPSSTLINILMCATSAVTIHTIANNITECTEDDLDEHESPDQAPPRILVQQAGIAAANGLFALDGRLFQGVHMYSRPGEYQGESCVYAIFQCLVDSKTKRWFISAIPINGRPGTNKDIDFYSALVTEECVWVPPTSGWKKSSDGDEEIPTLIY